MAPIKQKTLLASLLALTVFLSAACWFDLGEPERWLLLNRLVAQKHALALLSGQVREVPESLVDTTMSTDSGIVIIALHNTHDDILVFSPDESGVNRFMLKNKNPTIRSLGNGWYQVKIEN